MPYSNIFIKYLLLQSNRQRNGYERKFHRQEQLRCKRHLDHHYAGGVF